MTPAIAATLAAGRRPAPRRGRAMSAIRDWLAHVFLGHRCDLCHERYRGWRTLLAHQHLDHAGDRT